MDSTTFDSFEELPEFVREAANKAHGPEGRWILPLRIENGGKHFLLEVDANLASAPFVLHEMRP